MKIQGTALAGMLLCVALLCEAGCSTPADQSTNTGGDMSAGTSGSAGDMGVTGGATAGDTGAGPVGGAGMAGGATAGAGTSGGTGGAPGTSGDPKSPWRMMCDQDPVCARTYPHIDDPMMAGEALVGTCPNGYVPKGSRTGEMNMDFPEDRMRRFIVRLPEDMSTPRPVMLCYTGTVESETAFCDSHWSQPTLGKLHDTHGFIVLIPYRDSSETSGPFDGRIWWPWHDGVNPPVDAEGPDVKFMVDMTKCVATKYPVDAGRIYVGGISAGGSMTLRTLAFASDFFAGGINASGTWYEGGAGPATPLPADNMIMISTWGGATDQWPATNPLTVYAKETKQASEYFAAMPKVTHLACSHNLGHRWPGIDTAARAAINDWLVDTLVSHPKGTDPATFTFSQPPAVTDTDMGCVSGVYTDH